LLKNRKFVPNIITPLSSDDIIVTSLQMMLSTYHVPTPRKRYDNILSNNFRTLKRIVVIFAKQHQQSKEKLQWNESLPQLINVATLPCKMKRSPSRYTTTPKRDKIPQKSQARNLLVYIVELSTPEVKVDIKVINASLTQNQC